MAAGLGFSGTFNAFPKAAPNEKVGGNNALYFWLERKMTQLADAKRERD